MVVFAEFDNLLLYMHWSRDIHPYCLAIVLELSLCSLRGILFLARPLRSSKMSYQAHDLGPTVLATAFTLTGLSTVVVSLR